MLSGRIRRRRAAATLAQFSRTSDFERGVALARRLEAGMTYINKNAQSRLGRRHMPFGGIKQSGIGTENSELGLAEFTEIHAMNFHKV